jgi:hypothetical protein
MSETIESAPSRAAGDTGTTMRHGEPAISDVPSLLTSDDWRAVAALNLVPDYTNGTMSFEIPSGDQVLAFGARLDGEDVVGFFVTDRAGLIREGGLVAPERLGQALRAAVTKTEES